MNESFVARSKIKRLILKMRNEKNKANKQTNKKNHTGYAPFTRAENDF